MIDAMPHRILLANTIIGTIFEGVMLACGMAITTAHYVANALVDRETMDSIRGADGALVGAVLIVAVLWLSKLADNRKLDQRHEEALKLQKENAEKLMSLTAESIKAHGMAVGAIKSMDRTIQALTDELESRPCAAASRVSRHVQQCGES